MFADSAIGADFKGGSKRKWRRRMFIRAVHPNTGLDAFRVEVREFCRSEMPDVVRRKQAKGQHLERHEYGAWLKRLGSRG